MAEVEAYGGKDGFASNAGLVGGRRRKTGRKAKKGSKTRRNTKNARKSYRRGGR
jgi:hypothetical protein